MSDTPSDFGDMTDVPPITPAELVVMLRAQDCGYDPPNYDHGHTACWFFGLVADTIEALRVELAEQHRQNRLMMDAINERDRKYADAMARWRALSEPGNVASDTGHR